MLHWFNSVTTHIDRLLPGHRSLMNWKRPECETLLSLPHPYPRSLWPKSFREPILKNVYSVELMIESMDRPVASGRILHILEVDSDFPVMGVQPYKKQVRRIYLVESILFHAVG